MINKVIKNIINNSDVDVNIEECFDEIFSGLSDSVISGVFLALLEMKQYDVDDIVAAINSARASVKKINTDIDKDFLIENICLNQCSEYLDISFALDIILSANNIGAIKFTSSNYFNKNNSFDTLKSFNIDAERLNIDTFEKTDFLYKYYPKDTPYLKYTEELNRILPFKTVLSIIINFLNPLGAKNCSVAISNKTLVEKYANICLNLGYSNSIVFSGDGFPYISIEGESKVSEAWKNKIFSYTITPELLGIERQSLSSVKVENREHNFEILNAIFNNKLKDANYDIIIINSALALYITKTTKSLAEGLELAKKTIDDGYALEKINQIKNTF